MSTIPLPALAAQPPQQPNLLGNVAQVMQIKSAQQQQALQQQTQQQNALNLQLQQQKVKDQKTVTDLFVKNNGDLDKTIMDAAQQGVTPETIESLQQHNIQMKNQTLDLVTKNAGEAKRQADLIQGAYNTVEQADPKDRPAVYQQQLIGLKQQGANVGQMPVQYPGDAQFKIVGATVQGYQQQIDQATKQSEAAKNVAQGKEATAKANNEQA